MEILLKWYRQIWHERVRTSLTIRSYTFHYIYTQTNMIRRHLLVHSPILFAGSLFHRKTPVPIVFEALQRLNSDTVFLFSIFVNIFLRTAKNCDINE